jgi:mono/diheme cytochrome c family protein
MRTQFFLLALSALALFAACRQDMHDQPKYKPQQASTFFADGRANRPMLAGTIARGRLKTDELLETGKVNGEFSVEFPMQVTADVLKRGASRYAIFCAPCHDASGGGNGMVVQRGMKQPVSFHVDRLKDSPAGYYFDVITNGFGAMYDYSDRIKVEDRWAIAAYIRVLQKAQNAQLADVPSDKQHLLQEPK